MSFENKTIGSLWEAFSAGSFGRLCKYECDYVADDFSCVRNTTLIDDFLGGDVSVSVLDAKISEKKEILLTVKKLLPEKMQGEVDDLLEVCEILRLGGRNELHKIDPSIENVTDMPSFVHMEANFWGGYVSSMPRQIQAIEAYLGLLENRYKDNMEKDFFDTMRSIGLFSRYSDASHPDPKKNIAREDVVSLYQDILDSVYHIPAHVRVSDVNNIVAIGDTLYIPGSDAYAFFAPKKMIELIAHEIEVHMLTYYNHKQFYEHFFVSPAQLIREEGLALFMEKSVHDDIENVATRAHLEIYMGEKMEPHAFKKYFFKLGMLLGEPYQKTFSRFLRRKRWMPFDHAAVSHKDVAYYQGYAHVENMAGDNDDIEALFSSRVVFDRVQNYDGAVMPQFVAQYLVFRKSGAKGDFFHYLQDTYRDHPGMHSLFDSIDHTSLDRLYKKYGHLFTK